MVQSALQSLTPTHTYIHTEMEGELAWKVQTGTSEVDFSVLLKKHIFRKSLGIKPPLLLLL